jgi:hypothetical protein
MAKIQQKKLDGNKDGKLANKQSQLTNKWT